jgi:hypothetical protein
MAAGCPKGELFPKKDGINKGGLIFPHSKTKKTGRPRKVCYDKIFCGKSEATHHEAKDKVAGAILQKITEKLSTWQENNPDKKQVNWQAVPITVNVIYSEGAYHIIECHVYLVIAYTLR